MQENLKVKNLFRLSMKKTLTLLLTHHLTLNLQKSSMKEVTVSTSKMKKKRKIKRAV